MKPFPALPIRQMNVKIYELTNEANAIDIMLMALYTIK